MDRRQILVDEFLEEFRNHFSAFGICRVRAKPMQLSLDTAEVSVILLQRLLHPERIFIEFPDLAALVQAVPFV